MSEETVTFNLELNVEKTTSSIRRLEGLLYRSMGLLKRFSGDENIDAAITKIQQLVLFIRLLHSAIIYLEAATGPIGWAFAAVGVVSAGFAVGDIMMEMQSH